MGHLIKHAALHIHKRSTSSTASILSELSHCLSQAGPTVRWQLYEWCLLIPATWVVLHWGGGVKVLGHCTNCLLLSKSANLISRVWLPQVVNSILQLVVACFAVLSIFTKISSRSVCASLGLVTYWYMHAMCMLECLVVLCLQRSLILQILMLHARCN